MNTRTRNRKGFTLIELLVVMLILGILAALIVPKLFGHQDDAKVAKAKTDIAELKGAVDRFRLDADRYPTDQEGLGALLVQPSDVPKWSKYIEQLPLDPWGHDYVYHDLGNNEVQIMSYGADGAPGGTGINEDITNAGAAPSQ